jgi:methylthioribose-1-phosphate isomerase
VSTVDPTLPDGSGIPIEERGAEELTGYRDLRWAPEGISARNPAFDVTPAGLITALITERGVLRPPEREAIRRLVDR